MPRYYRTTLIPEEQSDSPEIINPIIVSIVDSYYGDKIAEQFIGVDQEKLEAQVDEQLEGLNANPEEDAYTYYD